MLFSEIAGRMTGFSTPFFGASWTPPTVDRDVARKVIAYLEDRRVLYIPSEVETADHCIESVQQMRRFFTEILGDGGIAKELEGSLRAMRAACRHFFDELNIRPGAEDQIWLPEHRRGGSYRSGLEDYMLNQVLGQLRGVFSIHVGQIAVAYKLDVEDGLASILPAKPE
jgi:hypothetical protein